MPILLAHLYAIGLAYVITGDSVAARDPRQFWLVLLTYPVSVLPGWMNSALNRM